ncbi:hypothetical protein L6164_026962 [Bauhinia variegata]|uniref:Uncharacterized protein n=1 Tax=Bauhinia variegata TaxID=167791 RepID=A0ACB9LRW5_BAUVA|nr:hypothetical protein L6164_026962 [Bauhinia variegata]
MPRYYCDYCDTYLTHDSPSVRKQHNAGYKHKGNVRQYYQQFEEQQTQSLIDQRIKEHLGQTAAFQQVGAAFNQHLMAQQPRFPVLPTPGMPFAGIQPLMPGIRPPVLPRPLPGAPGYVYAPSMPPMIPPVPGQMNTIAGAPTVMTVIMPMLKHPRAIINPIKLVARSRRNLTFIKFWSYKDAGPSEIEIFYM